MINLLYLTLNKILNIPFRIFIEEEISESEEFELSSSGKLEILPEVCKNPV